MSGKNSMRRCPTCGAVLDSSAALLCASCGRTVPTKEPERCEVCGAQYDPVIEQCPICGAERVLAPSSRASSLVTVALGLLALAVVVALALQLRPWQNAELDPDKLVSAAMDRLGPTRAPTPANSPPTPPPLPTTEPTPTAFPTPTVTPSPTLPLAPTLTPTALAETAEPTLEPTAEPVAQPETSAATGKVEHEIASGETLLAIARRYGVDYGDIMRANGLTESSVLRVGQVLEIPGQAATSVAPTTLVTATMTPTTATTAAPLTPSAERTTLPSPTPTQRPENLRHTVAKGEVLGQIAMRYGVTSEEIAAANDITVRSVLSIGQVLVIPGLEPEATPTPEPSPTPTLTPTVAARAQAVAAAVAAPAYAWKYLTPQPLAPLDGAVFIGLHDVPLLSWASVGILADNEWYRLRVWPSSGVVEAQVVWTKSTSWRADATLFTGERRELNWQVVVATRTEADEIGMSLSEPSIKQSFVWR